MHYKMHLNNYVLNLMQTQKPHVNVGGRWNVTDLLCR